MLYSHFTRLLGSYIAIVLLNNMIFNMLYSKGGI